MNYLYFNIFLLHQVFLFRSWASVGVMTAEQRAALLEIVARRDLSENLSFEECEKIANDLNLTLEQVILRFLYSTECTYGAYNTCIFNFLGGR